MAKDKTEVPEMSIDEMCGIAREYSKKYRFAQKIEKMIADLAARESTLSALKSQESVAKGNATRAANELAALEKAVEEKNKVLNAHDAEIKAKEAKKAELIAYLQGGYISEENDAKQESLERIQQVKQNADREIRDLNKKIKDREEVLSAIEAKVKAGEAKLAEMRAITI